MGTPDNYVKKSVTHSPKSTVTLKQPKYSPDKIQVCVNYNVVV